jgi:HAD superfamily hydrolase (TIGR01509 family)
LDDAVNLDKCTAVLFDLDGVLTDTASVHERAWRRTFTAVFEASDSARYTIADYFTYIDGKPRVEGVRAVLASRGIRLPEGGPDDDPGLNTLHGLGNRKNALFMAELTERGPRTFPGATELLDWLESHAVPKGVVSSSRNAEPVLRAGGLRDKVDVVVDGVVAAKLGLSGKPDPATYLYAAAALDSPPASTIVVEDATSGVEAGRRGGFQVIGLDRGAGREDLIRHGAHVVVNDLDAIFTHRH